MKEKSTEVYKVFKMASIPKRFIAKILNLLIVGIPFLAGMFLFETFNSDIKVAIIVNNSIILIVLLIQAIFLTNKGQSIGKYLIGIKLVRENDGQEGGFNNNVLLRTILNAILCLVPIYRIVDLIMGLSQSQKCIHDRMSNTIVVDIKNDYEKLTMKEIEKEQNSGVQGNYISEGRVFFGNDIEDRTSIGLIIASYIIVSIVAIVTIISINSVFTYMMG